MSKLKEKLQLLIDDFVTETNDVNSVINEIQSTLSLLRLQSKLSILDVENNRHIALIWIGKLPKTNDDILYEGDRIKCEEKEIVLPRQYYDPVNAERIAYVLTRHLEREFKTQ